MKYLILIFINSFILYKLCMWYAIYPDHVQIFILKGFVIFGFAQIIVSILLIQFIIKKIKTIETK